MVVLHFIASASHISRATLSRNIMPLYVRFGLGLCWARTAYALLLLLSSDIATVLSSQQFVSCARNPSKACRTLSTRFEAMCAETNSNLGMVSPCFASLAFADTRPCVVPEGWLTTAYTTAATPLPLASPKACNTIDSMSSWKVGIERGTATCAGNCFSHLSH